MKEALHFVVFLTVFRVVQLVEGGDDSDGDGDFGAGLISNLRNDANLDLSVDEEYEDLRAELLAYHTALATLTASQSRRSMMTTPCWELGGICVNQQLCTGFRYLTEIPGCKDRLNVCCFTWNKFRVRGYRNKGIGNPALPWSLKTKFGGKGVVEVEPIKKKKKNEHKEKGKQKVLNVPTLNSSEIKLNDPIVILG